MNNIDTKKILTIFICGILLVLVAPFLLTRSFGFASFTDTGTIGDTIGGVTAPITSLLGSILVFFALKAQIEANKIITDQFNQQKLDEIERKRLIYFSEKINLVRSDINDFSYIDTEHDTLVSGDRQKTRIHYKGADALSQFVEQIRHYGDSHEDEDPFKKDPKLTELFNLLKIVEILVENVSKENISSEDKNYFLQSIAYQFNSKVKPPFTANERHRSRNTEVCSKCGKHHYGIPDKIFEVVDSIADRLKNFS